MALGLQNTEIRWRERLACLNFWCLHRVVSTLLFGSLESGSIWLLLAVEIVVIDVVNGFAIVEIAGC